MTKPCYPHCDMCGVEFHNSNEISIGPGSGLFLCDKCWEDELDFMDEY